MSASPSAASLTRPFFGRGITATLATVLLLAAAACENKGIGRVCDPRADGGATQAYFNDNALECPSQLCIKPAATTQNARVDTEALCTVECTSNADCEDGEGRSAKSSLKKCQNGFVCGVAFFVGKLGCKKLCLCKDFIGNAADVDNPAICDPTKNPNLRK